MGPQGVSTTEQLNNSKKEMFTNALHININYYFSFFMSLFFNFFKFFIVVGFAIH